MTQCSKCDEWQHICHMNWTQERLDSLPEDASYACERCDPVANDNLITYLEAGGAPLTPQDVERRAVMKLVAKVKKPRKSQVSTKGGEDSSNPSRQSTPAGKKGRDSGRASVPDDTDKDTAPLTSTGRKRKAAATGKDSTPVESSKKVRSRFGSLRNDPELTNDQRGAKAPRLSTDTMSTPSGKPTRIKRGDSTVADPMLIDTPATDAPAAPLLIIQDELVSSVHDLADETRKKLVLHLVQSLAKAISQLVIAGSSTEAFAHTEESRAKQALEIEHAVYLKYRSADTRKPSKEGAMQIQRISLNLPRNAKLLHGVLSGEITREELAIMDDDGMATEEKKQADAAIQERVDKQAMVHKEDSTRRIRKTHKGDEEIEISVQEPAEPMTRPKTPTKDEYKYEQSELRQPSSEQPDVSLHQPLHPSESLNVAEHQSVNGQDPMILEPKAVEVVSTPLAPPVVDHDHQVSDVPEPSFEEYKPEFPNTPAAKEVLQPGPRQIWNGEIWFSENLSAPAAGFYLAKRESRSKQDPRDFIGERVIVRARLAMDAAESYIDSVITRSHQKSVYVLAIRSVACSNCNLDGCESCDKQRESEALLPSAEAAGQRGDRPPADRLSNIFDYFKNKEKHGVVEIGYDPRIESCYLIPLRNDTQALPRFFRRLSKDLLKPELIRSGCLGLLVFVIHGEDKAAAPMPATPATPVTPANPKIIPPIDTESAALYSPSPVHSPGHPPVVSAINDTQTTVFPLPAQANSGRTRVSIQEPELPQIPFQPVYQQPGLPNRVTNNHQPPPIAYAPVPPTGISANSDPVLDRENGVPAAMPVGPPLDTYISFPQADGNAMLIPRFLLPYTRLEGVNKFLNTATEAPLGVCQRIKSSVDVEPQAGIDFSLLMRRVFSSDQGAK